MHEPRRLTRRTFVAWLSSAVPLVLVARRADAIAASWLAADEATMRALARAVLPSELGDAGAARVARDFQRWIDDSRENVEMVHDYGASALRYTRPSPRAKWAAQLEGMRREGFGSRSLDQRRQAIQSALAGDKLDRMPEVAAAPHVAVGLLAFYFGSSEAADRCHGARIGRETCRSLATGSRKPLPLAPSTP